MKAIYIEDQGSTDVLTYGDRPDPIMKESEVLIAIKAASINRFDIYARSGANKVPIAFPRILGEDLSGEVLDASIPALESGIFPGSRVVVDPRIPCWECIECRSGRNEDCSNRQDLGYNIDGSYAEIISVPWKNVYTIPDSISFEEAAAMPIVFKTAWRMLVTKAKIKPGETVLIHSAGSGVGSAAIQIANFFGCNIITTVGADWKLLKAKEIGVAHALNYQENKNWPDYVKDITNGEGVDVIIDSVGENVWEGSYRCLKRQGRFVTCGVTSGHKVNLHLGQLFLNGYEIMGVGGFRYEEFQTIMKLVHANKLKGIVGAKFPLQESAEAHQLMESRNFFGKIILTT